MPRTPCPTGQTRNRVTKSCRDKKKPGRKAGTRKAVKRTAIFHVELASYEPNNNNDPKPGDHADKIIKWYKGHIPDTEHEGELEVKSVSHICGNLFKITYTGHGRWVDGPNSIALENFLNPDDDGNEPITIRGKKYLISGYLEDN